MDGFDLFILPSVKEGLPFALLEAMDASLPCLATDVGGIPEVIGNGVNGWLTDPSRLASALGHALAHQDQWKTVGTKANATVRERFTDQGMIKKTFELYAALLKRQNG
jgi:glycosyltransferase involved in cell wall biosynthesis